MGYVEVFEQGDTGMVNCIWEPEGVAKAISTEYEVRVLVPGPNELPVKWIKSVLADLPPEIRNTPVSIDEKVTDECGRESIKITVLDSDKKHLWYALGTYFEVWISMQDNEDYPYYFLRACNDISDAKRRADWRLGLDSPWATSEDNRMVAHYIKWYKVTEEKARMFLADPPDYSM